MKKLLASVSFLVLGSATVLAADLPVRYSKAPPPMMAPAFNWTGCYVGAHVGGGALHDSWTGEHGNGGLAGGQLGCNYQTGMLVFGIEGEGYWSGMDAKYTEGTGFGSTGNLSFDTTKNKHDFTVAGRFGVALDRTLVYGKAGWAWGNFDFRFDPSSQSYYHINNSTLNGLLIGAGIEHAITNNWTVKFEYNYLNFGSKYALFDHCESGLCNPEFYRTVGAEKHIFKLGANYLFNLGGSAVVAKY